MNKVVLVVGLSSLILVIGCIISHSDIVDEIQVLIGSLQPIHGNEFDGVLHLREWLTNNSVSENIYVTNTYDCDNFAIDLCKDASHDGYIMKPGFISTGFGKFHVICKTLIDDIWYQIAAQTDKVITLPQ